MVAKFADRKDQRTFIEAAKILLSEHDDLVFVLIGDGPKRREIEMTVSKSYQDKKLFFSLNYS